MNGRFSTVGRNTRWSDVFERCSVTDDSPKIDGRDESHLTLDTKIEHEQRPAPGMALTSFNILNTKAKPSMMDDVVDGLEAFLVGQRVCVRVDFFKEIRYKRSQRLVCEGSVLEKIGTSFIGITHMVPHRESDKFSGQLRRAPICLEECWAGGCGI